MHNDPDIPDLRKHGDSTSTKQMQEYYFVAVLYSKWWFSHSVWLQLNPIEV